MSSAIATSATAASGDSTISSALATTRSNARFTGDRLCAGLGQAGGVQQRAIEAVDVVDQAADLVARQYPLATRCAEPLTKPGIAREPREALGELLRRLRGHEEAVHALADDVGDAADPRRDHGAPGGQRLDHAHRSPLVARRQDERVEGAVERSDVLLVAEEERVADDPELVGAALELRAVRAVADEAERRFDAAFAQQPEALEDVVAALNRRHAAHPADGEAFVGDAQIASCLGAAVRRGDPFAQLDPEPDDRELLRRRDAELDEIVAHLRADGDEHGCVAR